MNHSILGMYIVDSWLAYSQVTNTIEKQSDFYMLLAEGMIDNNFDDVIGWSAQRAAAAMGWV